MSKLKLLELFGGIGACSKALERLGIDYEIVDYVEIDKYAVASYNAMHNTNFEPQDITTWNKDVEVDLIMHGSPCQDFSVAGKQAGGDENSGTRSSLMYETIRIVDKLKLKDMLEEAVDEKYYLSEKMIDYILDNNNTQEGTKWEGRADNDTLNSNIAHTLSVRGAGGSQRAGVSNFLIDGEKEEIKVKDLKAKINIVGKTKSGGERSLILKTDGICNTLSATDYKQPKQILEEKNYLKIKNNTKKGYLEARDGDGVYIVTSNKRGTVQPQMIQTITTRQDLGVVTTK